jgi:hypothetical protein
MLSESKPGGEVWIIPSAAVLPQSSPPVAPATRHPPQKGKDVHAGRVLILRLTASSISAAAMSVAPTSG